MNEPARPARYLSLLTVLYVVLQLVSDVTGGKIVDLCGFGVSVTILWFPFTYIFSDILTEVYGYARARAVLWTVLFASIGAGLIYQVAAYFPPAAGFPSDAAYRRVLGQVPRTLAGGWIAVFAGNIANDYIVAKLKVFLDGRMMWLRFLLSTIAGQFINTSLFYVIALYGVLPRHLLIVSILAGWLMKTGIETILLPITCRIARYLKRVEGQDIYDRGTDFNPFRLLWPI